LGVVEKMEGVVANEWKSGQVRRMNVLACLPVLALAHPDTVGRV
jgi:hypothetical protein